MHCSFFFIENVQKPLVLLKYKNRNRRKCYLLIHNKNVNVFKTNNVSIRINNDEGEKMPLTELHEEEKNPIA